MGLSKSGEAAQRYTFNIEPGAEFSEDGVRDSLRALLGEWRNQGAVASVILPPSATLEVVPPEPPQPEPAPGQVWGFGMNPDPDVIVAIDGDVARFSRGASPLLHYLANEPRWKCLGVETPAGRVMVGERRAGTQFPFRRARVIAIASYGAVKCEDETGATRLVDGVDVASWPLAAEPAPPTEQSAAPWREVSAKFTVYDRSPIGTVSRVLGKTADGEPVVEVALGPSLYGMPAPAEAMPWYREAERALAAAGSFKLTQEEAQRLAEKLGAPLAPRAQLEARRCRIDRVLAEDARQHPAFATARKCAVMAAEEAGYPYGAGWVLDYCHRYEACRGGGRAPLPSAVTWREGSPVAAFMAAYERARGL